MRHDAFLTLRLRLSETLWAPPSRSVRCGGSPARAQSARSSQHLRHHTPETRHRQPRPARGGGHRPPKTRKGPGRPAHYPAYVYLIYLAAISLYDSSRHTQSTFQETDNWKIIRTGIRRFLGDEEADALPENGPSLYQWNDFYRKKLRPAVHEFREACRDAGLGRPSPTACSPKRRNEVIGSVRTAARPSTATALWSASFRPDRGIHRRREDRRATTPSCRSRRRDPNGGWRQNCLRKEDRLLLRAPGSKVSQPLHPQRRQCPPPPPGRRSRTRRRSIRRSPAGPRDPGPRPRSHRRQLRHPWRGKHRAPLIRRGLIVFTRQHEGIKPHPWPSTSASARTNASVSTRKTHTTRMPQPADPASVKSRWTGKPCTTLYPYGNSSHAREKQGGASITASKSLVATEYIPS